MIENVHPLLLIKSSFPSSNYNIFWINNIIQLKDDVKYECIIVDRSKFTKDTKGG